jgi:hypothetical protein
LGPVPTYTGEADFVALDDEHVCIEKQEARHLTVYIKRLQDWVDEAQACLAKPQDAGITEASTQ